MKFSTDKKSLFIYTNDIMKGSDVKMESALKKELEATKSALKLQTIRCRQLVAAFTRKLHEKELELRASKDLRDQQLSRLLRALLILESRLKKEQKQIRQQLQEKDLIIEKHEKEISKLKAESVGKWSDSENVGGSGKWATVNSKHSNTTGEERLDNLCKGLINTSPLYKQETASEVEIKNEYNSKKEVNTFRDNPVLESVNQILLRDEEELLKNVQPVSINLTEKGMFANEGDSNEWYETNSIAVIEEQTDSDAWCINVEEKKEQEVKKKDASVSEKTSPIKSQHLEEKACLEMSKKNLTVVDLEEIDSGNTDRAISPAKSTASYEEIIPVSTNKTYKPRIMQKPPALPPKPARLLKPYQILQQKNQNLQHPAQQNESGNAPSSSQSLADHPVPRPPQILQQKNSAGASCPFLENLDLQHPTQQNESGNAPPSSQSSADHPVPRSPQTSGKTSQPVPKQPLTLSQTSANTRHRVPEPKNEAKETDKVRTKPLDPNPKPKKTQGNGHQVGSLDSVDCIVTPQFGKQKKKEEVVANCGAIKIGSSVSSLITGLSRDTIVTELSGQSLMPSDDSHVSQLVRQFEVLGKLGMIDSERTEDEVNDIRKNFEEFKLEDSYVDSVIEGEENGRHEGDGAENRNMINYYATLTIVPPSLPKEGPPGAELEYKMYETFLENTGLSQKSILTPSRMLSNHRSCLKPKDVKHRSRIKAAAAIEKCNVNATNGGSTVKYWTEPFL